MKVLANQFDRLGFITLGLLNRALNRQHLGLRLAGPMSWISCGVVFAAWDNTWAHLTAVLESPDQKLITDIDSGDAARTFTSSVH